MATTEVTIARYRHFKPDVKATGADDEAMTEVSWHDAEAFCKWLFAKEGKSYWLPTGALLFCSFTDQQSQWKQRMGMAFKTHSTGSGQAVERTEFTGYGLFAAVSFDEGKTWPVRRLISSGGPERTVSGVDHHEFTLSETMAELSGYLADCQTRDGMVQLISSKNHYVFNLAWLKALPPPPAK